MIDVTQAKKKAVDFVTDVCMSEGSCWTSMALVLGWRAPRGLYSHRAQHHFTHAIGARPEAYDDLLLVPDSLRHVSRELPSVIAGTLQALPSARQGEKEKILARLRSECLAPRSPWRSALVALGWRTPETPDLIHHFTHAVAVKPGMDSDLQRLPATLLLLAEQLDATFAGLPTSLEVTTHRKPTS